MYHVDSLGSAIYAGAETVSSTSHGDPKLVGRIHADTDSEGRSSRTDVAGGKSFERDYVLTLMEPLARPNNGYDVGFP